MSWGQKGHRNTRTARHLDRKARWEVVEAALLLILALTIFFWPAVFGGRVLLPYVADYAFRAVVVPAGTHQVEFKYEPLSFKTGATISLLACGSMAGAAAGLLLTGRRLAG
jgi:hypothetical protein